MRTGEASSSAAAVAALRGFGRYLPPGLCVLAADPYGVALAGAPYTWLRAFLEARPRLAAALFSTGPLHRWTLAMALRTRALDDAVRRFAAAGGRQVLLLGAGLDARPWRLAGELPRDMRYYEVDFPPSQAAKRAALAAALAAERRRVEATSPASTPPPLPDVTWLPHDLEAPPAALRDALLAAGMDATQPVATIWEGVVMYLSEQALEANVALLRDISAPGSVLTLNYIVPGFGASAGPRPERNSSSSAGAEADAPAALQCQTPAHRRALGLLSALTARLGVVLHVWWWILLWLRIYAGEPMRFVGWPRGTQPGRSSSATCAEWLAQRGWRMRADRGYADVAAELGGPGAALMDGRALVGEERFVEAERAAQPQS